MAQSLPLIDTLLGSSETLLKLSLYIALYNFQVLQLIDFPQSYQGLISIKLIHHPSSWYKLGWTKQGQFQAKL